MKRELSSIAGFLILTVTLLLVFLFSCKKLDPERQMLIKTESVFNISYTSCEAKAVVIDAGPGIVEHGFCWDEQAEPVIEGSLKTEMGPKGSTGEFSGFIPGLEPGTQYYIRAYATSKKETVYGSQKSFNTNSLGTPGVDIVRVDSIRETSVFVECDVFSDGGDEISEKGVCWNISGSPDIDDTKIPLGNGMGIYSCTIEALDPATTYYLKAYAINGQGIAYGVQHEVTTASSASVSDYWVADAEVLPMEVVAGTNFTVNCRHFSNGQDDMDRPVNIGYFLSNNDVFDQGDIYLGFDESNIGSTEFSDESSELTLPAGTVAGNYFILFYSDFDEDYPEIDEGNNIAAVEFTVKPLYPEVTTFPVGDVTDNSANTGGEVLEDYGLDVTERGVCWSTSPGPEITDMKTTDSGGTGIFYSAISTLSPDTKYYLRAYATNSSGTAYGEELVFTTMTGEIVYDYDGNMYQVIRIGDQEWLASNMKATSFTTGEPILLEEGDWSTVDLADKAYRWYGNDIGNKGLYGALYSWPAAMNGSPGSNTNPSGIQGVCPDAWHIPSSVEWDQLREYLIDNGYNWDGSMSENKIGKSLALTFAWNPADILGQVGNDLKMNNASGFSAVPGGGIRSTDNQYYSLGEDAYMWSATNGDYASAYASRISSQQEALFDASLSRSHGISVRCVKGQGAVPPVANFEADRTTIAVGETVYFSDLSEWGPETWTWSFGYMDAGSNLQNPSFTYTEYGNYTIELTVSNAAGTDTETKISYITVTPPSVTDFDGNIYQTVQIGDQVWMAENLKVTHYWEGTEIPLVEDAADWENMAYTAKAYCYYDNNPDNGGVYGALYTWGAAMNGAAGSSANPSGVQGVCPTGWHLPSDEEWKQMEMYLGMSQEQADAGGLRGTNEGSKLAGDPALWLDGALESDAAFGSSGFNALPGSAREWWNGSFVNLGGIAHFWTTTESASVDYAGNRYLQNAYTQVGRAENAKMTRGYSVRCIKDD